MNQVKVRKGKHHASQIGALSSLSSKFKSYQCNFGVALDILRFPCVRTHFQLFVNNDGLFPGPTQRSHIAGFSSDTVQKPEQTLVRGGYVREIWWMGKKFPAVLINPLHAQTKNVCPCCRVGGWFSMPWTFVRYCITKLLDRLKVQSGDGNFTFLQILDN